MPGLRELYDAYSLNVIPKIGRYAPHKWHMTPLAAVLLHGTTLRQCELADC